MGRDEAYGKNERGLPRDKNLAHRGKITYEGKHFKYTGLFTTARPVRTVPLYMGAIGGPRSFQLAGEIADGIMAALGYSAEFLAGPE